MRCRWWVRGANGGEGEGGGGGQNGKTVVCEGEGGGSRPAVCKMRGKPTAVQGGIVVGHPQNLIYSRNVRCVRRA